MMDAKQAIKMNMDMAALVCDSYLSDLSDDDLMKRPHPSCNHLKWQLGHLISAEHTMIDGAAPGSMPALPDGFAERYAKEAAGSDDASAFDSKDVLMQAYQAQREATLAALEAFPAEKLDDPGPEEMRSYAPTMASLFALQGSHWLMHAGQWVPIRRECGKDIVI